MLYADYQSGLTAITQFKDQWCILRKLYCYQQINQYIITDYSANINRENLPRAVSCVIAYVRILHVDD